MLERLMKKGPLLLVFLIMLMDVVGISIFYPIAAFVVQKYSSDASMVTLLSALYSAAQFIGAPILGKLSDRFGRRPLLLASLLGSIAGYVLFGIGGSLWVLLLSRLIDGLSGGNMSIASAYIADVSAPEERAKNFTLVGLAWGIGLVLGPALGSALGQINLMLPAFLAAGLMLLCTVLGWFFLPESLPRESRETGKLSISALNPFQAIWCMIRKPSVGWFLLIIGLFNLAINGTNNVGSLFMIARFHAQPWHVGLLLVLMGIVIALVQLFGIPFFQPRFGEKKIATASMLGQVLGGIGVFFSGSMLMYFPVSLIATGISGFIYPSLTALASNRVEEKEIGSLMGVSTSLNSLTNILGPLWAGAVFDLFTPGAPFLFASAVYMLAFLLLIWQGFLRLMRRTRQNEADIA